MGVGVGMNGCGWGGWCRMGACGMGEWMSMMGCVVGDVGLISALWMNRCHWMGQLVPVGG